MNGNYLDTSFGIPLRTSGAFPLQVAYRPQISPDIEAENISITDSVQISAAGTEEAADADARQSQTAAGKTGISPPRQQPLELSTARVRVVLPPPAGPDTDLASADRQLDEDAALQALTTAYLVDTTFDRYWQGEPTYRLPNSETLTIRLNHPAAHARGPFYRAAPSRTIFTGSASAAADPDIIAHEQGHAILDSYCRYNTGNSFTASAHEAFADVTAMLTALQSAQVRENVCRAWERGELSTLLSVIGEGAGELQRGPSSSPGLRDLSTVPIQSPEKDFDEPHSASQRFSHGVYSALHAMYKLERSSDPFLPAAKAMERVSERFSADFVNSVRYLPRRPIISQRDLAHALLQADLDLHSGQDSGIYRQNLKHLL